MNPLWYPLFCVYGLGWVSLHPPHTLYTLLNRVQGLCLSAFQHPYTLKSKISYTKKAAPPFRNAVFFVEGSEFNLFFCLRVKLKWKCSFTRIMLNDKYLRTSETVKLVLLVVLMKNNITRLWRQKVCDIGWCCNITHNCQVFRILQNGDIGDVIIFVPLCLCVHVAYALSPKRVQYSVMPKIRMRHDEILPVVLIFSVLLLHPKFRICIISDLLKDKLIIKKKQLWKNYQNEWLTKPREKNYQ